MPAIWGFTGVFYLGVLLEFLHFAVKCCSYMQKIDDFIA